ncbi:MAG: mechanosensitive ion channel domain-containing protein, partial [Bacteroidota bacterium]
MKEILLYQYQDIISVNLFQVVELIIAAFLLWLVYRAIRNRFLPWYFGMEATSSKNFARSLRVLRLVLYSFFVVLALRVFNLDYQLIREPLLSAEELKQFEMENPDAANDNPLEFIVRISTLIKAILAFVVANLLDLIIGEVATQRFYRRQVKAKQQMAATASAGGAVADRILWLKPFLYLLAIALVANDTGIVHYTFFDIPHGTDPAVPFTVGKLIQGLLIFLLVSLIISFATSFLLKGYYNRTKIDTGSQFAINRLLTYFAYFIGVLLVIQTAGFNLVVIWTGAAALLVGVGIGLQQTFNDLICGIIILFERSVKVGDVLELTGHQVGTVRKIGARTSVLETRDDIIIFVPNSKLIGENVTNWSQ